MPIPSPSCAVAFPRKRNNATDAQSATCSATAMAPTARKPASIQELRTQLRAQPARNYSEEPETARQPELRTATVNPGCAVALPLERNRAPDAAEGRRQRVIAMLNKHPDTRYAVVVNNPDTDPVIVALGIRGHATCELRIPRAKYDPFLLLDLIERHSGTVH